MTASVDHIVAAEASRRRDEASKIHPRCANATIGTRPGSAASVKLHSHAKKAAVRCRKPILREEGLVK
jgi:hypothetical protein